MIQIVCTEKVMNPMHVVLVVWAIKEGRDCAKSVDKYIKKKQLT